MARPGRGLDPQPLGALASRVQAGGEHGEPDRVQVTRQLVTDPGVATRHQDGLALWNGDRNCKCTLQSKIKSKLSLLRLWSGHENALIVIEKIPTIPHNTVRKIFRNKEFLSTPKMRLP